ncbi:MAG: hypothetical protein D6722_05375 [Bacteroidetes bacterium]|nr:MAG: hypothetical protein D6722_05375 [Bacteroidota bacterium]
MKKINLIFSLLAFAFVLSACVNLEKVLPQNTGTWKAVSGKTSTFEDGVAVVTDSTYTITEEITFQFNEDGTGVYTEDGQDTDFEWSYNAEDEKLSMTMDGITIVYDVLEFTRNTMTIFTSFEFEFFGINIKTDSSLDLEKTE